MVDISKSNMKDLIKIFESPSKKFTPSGILEKVIFTFSSRAAFRSWWKGGRIEWHLRLRKWRGQKKMRLTAKELDHSFELLVKRLHEGGIDEGLVDVVSAIRRGVVRG